MIRQTYLPKELCQKLTNKGIEASFIRKFEHGGTYYKSYTLDVVCKWLREVHGLHIYAFRLDEWHYEIQNLKEDYTHSFYGGISYDEAIINAIDKVITIMI